MQFWLFCVPSPNGQFSPAIFFCLDLYCKPAISPPIRAGRASAPQFSSLFLSSSSSFSAAAAATRKERERETKEEGALARRSCSSSCGEISEAIARPTQPQSQIRLRRRRLRGEVAGFFLCVRGFMAPLLPRRRYLRVERRGGGGRGGDAASV